jgi:hypothetical protein
MTADPHMPNRRKKQNRGKLVQRLHEACQEEPPSLGKIRAVVTHLPSTAEFRSTTDQWLPLHRACRRQPSVATLQLLVRAYPASVREWTADGLTEPRLPLHLACQHGAPLAVIQYLAAQDPTCLQAVTPHKMYTALDFSLYYFHQRKRQGLDCTHAERVVEWLAQVRVVERASWEAKKPEEEAIIATPAVVLQASWQPQASLSDKAEPQEQKTAWQDRKQAAEPLVVVEPPPVPRRSSSPIARQLSRGGSSKIIRIRLPRR